MTRSLIRSLALALALSGAITSVSAKAPVISASLNASEVLVKNGLADTTFTIEVTNRGDVPVSDVRVVFGEGDEIAVGDVAPESSATSSSQRRVFDTSALPSRNFPVEVTIRYSQDGADVEAAATLLLRIS